MKQRRLHKAFLRYHDPENWQLLRDELKRMGRRDLIGNGKVHLVPPRDPPKRHRVVKDRANPSQPSTRACPRGNANDRNYCSPTGVSTMSPSGRQPQWLALCLAALLASAWAPIAGAVITIGEPLPRFHR